ncbi:MAG: ABC transporter substrate-binding protein, partial [Lachnospiraceae bacterium]|nr:ABC transporter substrate-binding protein [Lachnospiraceae bacterium]
MHKTGKTVLITVIVLSALILVCVLLSMRRVETFEDKYAGADLTTDVAGMERTGTYTGYLTAHADAARPQQVIDVDIAGFEAEGDVHMVDELDGETGVVYTDTASVATWTVDVPEAGMYRLHIRYYLPESRGVAAERSVSINGETPFERANNICFSRVWTDGGPVRTDNRG